ncbi:hypothetical protein [Phenylobacterium sp.]|uniref:hypothetical protein n=1 Tax=Phenylobacterium sp. TaxID=1871053 RepID=UPI0035B2BBD8
MHPHDALVDTSTFQLGVLPEDDPQVEQPLLDALARDARAFVESHRWAPPITDLLMAFGIGGIIGLFLVRFACGIRSGEGRGDTEIWVVVGDLPSIYFETEDIETPAKALETYCGIAEDWAACVLEGLDVADAFPIPVAPTREHAEMLLSRLETIRREFIPLAEQL